MIDVFFLSFLALSLLFIFIEISNLVPRAFPSKKGWGGCPTHFLRGGEIRGARDSHLEARELAQSPHPLATIIVSYGEK